MWLELNQRLDKVQTGTAGVAEASGSNLCIEVRFVRLELASMNWECIRLGLRIPDTDWDRCTLYGHIHTHFFCKESTCRSIGYTPEGNV